MDYIGLGSQLEPLVKAITSLGTKRTTFVDFNTRAFEVGTIKSITKLERTDKTSVTYTITGEADGFYSCDIPYDEAIKRLYKATHDIEE